MTRLLAIDDSNRGDHYYLTPDDSCFFLHEFTARKGYGHSPANQFIFNFKKSPLKQNEGHYHYKRQAIEQAIRTYRQLFDQAPNIYREATFTPIPSSRLPGDPAYDDRMWQVVQGVCAGKGADARELIVQTQAYEAAHLQGPEGSRIKPDELRAIYRLNPPPPKSTVVVFDDVLSAGSHFRAVKSTILAAYPGTTVYGMFLARRVLPDTSDDFDVLDAL